MYEHRLYVKHGSNTEDTDRRPDFFNPRIRTFECNREYWTISRTENETHHPGYTRAVYRYSSKQPNLNFYAKDLDKAELKKQGHVEMLGRLQANNIRHCITGDTVDFDFYDFHFESSGDVALLGPHLKTVPNAKSLETIGHFATKVSICSSAESIRLDRTCIETHTLEIDAAKSIIFNCCKFIIDNLSINKHPVTLSVLNLLRKKGFTITPQGVGADQQIVMECTTEIKLSPFELRCVLAADLEPRVIESLKDKLLEVTGCQWRYGNTDKFFWLVGSKTQITAIKELFRENKLNYDRPKQVAGGDEQAEPQYCIRLSNEHALQLGALTAQATLRMK